MQEQEIKIELESEADHRRLAEALERRAGPPRVLRQLNRYFDTVELTLASRLVMFRIRESDRVLVTYKSGTEVEAGYFSSREIEAPLAPEDVPGILRDPARLYDLAIAPVETLRAEHGRLELREIGTLENERRVYALDGYTLELDRMRFADGGEEYELEIESEAPDAARDWCTALLAELGVSGRPGRETKFQRLLRRRG